MTAFSQAVRITELPNSQVAALTVLANRLALDNLNFAVASAGLALSTNTLAAKTVNSTPYQVDGVWQTALAATDNFFTPPATSPVLNGTTAVPVYQKYLCCVQAAGVALVIAGVPSTVGLANVVYTTAPDAAATFGEIQVTASATFTPGTTALNAANITAVFNSGTSKALYPVIADAASGNEYLAINGGAGSYLG